MTDRPIEQPASRDKQPDQGHFIYIVQCANGTLYTGYTTNVARRIAAHNNGKGAKYTRAHRPVNLLASWKFSDKKTALQAEYAIKRFPRAKKLKLIEGPPENIALYI